MLAASPSKSMIADAPVRHSGQAKREPESSRCGPPAPAYHAMRCISGMTPRWLHLLEPHALSVGFVLFCNLRVLRVTGMNVDPVAETHRLSLLQGMAAIFGLVVVEIVQSKGIHCEKSIAANVPVARMTKAAWMIKNGNADEPHH